MIEVGSSKVQPSVSDFCFGIIKHDALALENGKDLILTRLGEAGLTVCGVKVVELSGSQLDIFYEDILDKPYYLPMKASIVGTVAECLVIGGDSNAAETVKALKGKPTIPGTIRGDLSYLNQMTIGDRRAFEVGTHTHDPETGRSFHDLIHMDDRFHSSAAEESRRDILATFTLEDIDKITSRYPAFDQFMRPSVTRQ